MYLQISMDLQMSSTLSDTQVCLEMSKKLHMWRCITTELQMFSTISLQPQVFIKYPYISLCVSPQDQICLCNSKGLSMCLQIQNPRRVYRSLQNCRCIYIAIKKINFLLYVCRTTERKSIAHCKHDHTWSFVSSFGLLCPSWSSIFLPPYSFHGV